MDGNNVDVDLPPRLFGTDRYPIRRLNVYSKPDILSFVLAKLDGTPEIRDLKRSRFGKLFTLPANRCVVSWKLIHALTTRQLLTNKRYEMWTVFGGHPLKFSLVEFDSLTGLNCGEYPENYDPDYRPPTEKGSTWEKFIDTDQ